MIAWLKLWLLRMARAWDRLWNAILGGDDAHTISASVGQWAAEGRRWALVAEWIIDRAFVVFARSPLGHCRRQAQREGLLP